MDTKQRRAKKLERRNRMKITLNDFNELQRWIKVRDCCREARYNLMLATSYANSRNFDKNAYVEAYNFADDLETKAIKKIERIVEND